MQGVLVVDKPAGWTSQDVVSKVRRLVGTKRAGHAGTLDPDATGVLVVAVGAATRLLPHLELEPKEYVATAVFGTATDTEDASGRVVETSDASGLNLVDLDSARTAFLGEIEQIPPMVSALHHQGKRLHELARAGIVVERAARRIVIHDLQLSDFVPGPIATCQLRVCCGGGTYVRTLCADLARSVGLPGHMGTLRRTRVGAFSIDNAVTLDQLSRDHVTPVESVLGHLAKCDIDESAATAIGHGMPVEAPGQLPDSETVAVTAGGKLIALASCVDGTLAPFRVFAAEADQ